MYLCQWVFTGVKKKALLLSVNGESPDSCLNKWKREPPKFEQMVPNALRPAIEHS